MSARVGTPVNQVRLTNVAYVRLQKRGKRFEIACYRNKVLNWRNKIETDLGEVLQADTVFTNVSKGMLASQKDLQEYFDTTDTREVCREILEKGELQVSEQERQALHDSTFRDIATIVADKSVNPENNRSYTISMIQNAMKQIHYSVSITKSAKQQALEVIKKLRNVMPIARANMLLRMYYPQNAEEELNAWLVAQRSLTAIVGKGCLKAGSGTDGTTQYADIRCDPEVFKRMDEVVREKTGGVGRVEVLQLRVASASLGVSSGGGGAVFADDDEEEIPLDEEIVEEPKKKTGSSSSRGDKAKSSESALKELLKSTMKALVIESDDDNDEEDGRDGAILAGGKKKKNRSRAVQFTGLSHTRSSSRSSDSHTESSSTALTDASDETTSSVFVQLDMLLPDGRPKGHKPLCVGGEGDDGLDAKRGDKKGKKSKRREKEEALERKEKEETLRNRLAKEQDELESLRLKSAAVCAGAASEWNSTSDSSSIATETSAGQSCNTCGGNFSDSASYRAHFRSEWHRHNLKLKLKGLPIITSEKLFLELSPVEINLS